MQMRKIYCFRSFALDSAHVKFDVWTGPKSLLPSVHVVHTTTKESHFTSQLEWEQMRDVRKWNTHAQSVQTTFSLFLIFKHANLLHWRCHRHSCLSRTHCCRHKCFPVCPRAQHLLRIQILCPGHKKCFWFCSETFCVRNKCFQVCEAWKHKIRFVSRTFARLRNIMSNNVSPTVCPRFPRLVE